MPKPIIVKTGIFLGDGRHDRCHNPSMLRFDCTQIAFTRKAFTVGGPDPATWSQSIASLVPAELGGRGTKLRDWILKQNDSIFGCLVDSHRIILEVLHEPLWGVPAEQQSRIVMDETNELFDQVAKFLPSLFKGTLIVADAQFMLYEDVVQPKPLT